MKQSTFLNAILLWTVNTLFLLIGVFLNAVVVISLWRSTQLRKKLCYFTILVLSCFDLVVVTIAHPFMILSTTFWFLEDHNEALEEARIATNMVLHGFSMFSLLTLNIERFLALTHPFFHQTSVNKRRLLSFLAILHLSFLAITTLSFKDPESIDGNIVATVYLSTFLVLFFCLNCKMYRIAKTKQRSPTLCGEHCETNLTQQNRREGFHSFKKLSTCSLAVLCFAVCSCPALVYCAVLLARGRRPYDEQVISMSLWAGTFVSMNSTFNCVIFFWRNTVLRREGLKLLKCFH